MAAENLNAMGKMLAEFNLWAVDPERRRDKGVRANMFKWFDLVLERYLRVLHHEPWPGGREELDLARGVMRALDDDDALRGRAATC